MFAFIEVVIIVDYVSTYICICMWLYNIVWMVSTRPPTSKSSRPFNNPLVTVPKAPITIGIIVTFMFHSFFNSQARSRYFSLFPHSFSFILCIIIIIVKALFSFFFSIFHWVTTLDLRREKRAIACIFLDVTFPIILIVEHLHSRLGL